MSTERAYSDYQTIELAFNEGILIVRFHTHDGPLEFSMDAHSEWVRLWTEIAEDPSVRLVILTGTADAFITARKKLPGGAQRSSGMTPQYWRRIMRECTAHVLKMLDVPVPIIAAVNGPIRNHSELALLSDIVIATPDATIQDMSHFPEQAIPTDLQHVLMPELIGRIRASYYFYSGRAIDAAEAQQLGLYNEIVTRERLMERAVQTARWILRQPDINLQYFRRVSTHDLRAKMNALLEYGLAMEGLAAMGADWTDWTVDPEGLPPLPA
ncbi:MAG: enoyl-CoA hydratase/isomerase family protein [Mycetocola sp.]